MALWGAPTTGQSEPESDRNEGVLCIVQSSYITGTSLNIRLLNIISRALVEGGVLPLCWEAVGVFYSPIRLGQDSNQKMTHRPKDTLTCIIKKRRKVLFYEMKIHSHWKVTLFINTLKEPIFLPKNQRRLSKSESEKKKKYLRSKRCILTFDPAQNAIQGDAPEGSDTFQWQLGEEIAWAEIG